MLYALGDPVSFVLLVVSFVVSATLAGWLTALATARVGLREPGRGRPDPRRQLDPFGSVGAAVAGFGWARPVEVPEQRRGGRTATALLTGPLVVLAVGLGLLAVFGAVYAPLGGGGSVLLQQGVPSGVLSGPGGAPVDLGGRALLLAGLMATYVGALSVVPLPPLPGGLALFALAPRTSGWQKARYQLVDRNIGTAVLLALLLVPLGGPQALLPTVLSSVLDPLVRLVSGG